MAISAVARETVGSLRHKIAKIEGRLAEHLGGGEEDSTGSKAISLRRHGLVAPDGGFLATGVPRLDAVLGGGLPSAALTEIHGSVMHGAGAAAGFALALTSLILKMDKPEKTVRPPLLWIGVSDAFAEAGFPYAPGLALFGLSPDELLIARTTKLADALWIAEEAARLKEISAVLLEIHGNPGRLDLTATRRLHRRAGEAGRPVFLIRQSAEAWPTAAPVRLVVSAASAAPRITLAGSLDCSIGHPAFTVAIGKSRTALPGQFILEWNPHERAFHERQPENSRSVVPASSLGPDIAAASGAILAFRPAGAKPASHHQSPGEEHPVHRRPRRAG